MHDPTAPVYAAIAYRMPLCMPICIRGCVSARQDVNLALFLGWNKLITR